MFYLLLLTIIVICGSGMEVMASKVLASSGFTLSKLLLGEAWAANGPQPSKDPPGHKPVGHLFVTAFGDRQQGSPEEYMVGRGLSIDPTSEVYVFDSCENGMASGAAKEESCGKLGGLTFKTICLTDGSTIVAAGASIGSSCDAYDPFSAATKYFVHDIARVCDPKYALPARECRKKTSTVKEEEEKMEEIKEGDVVVQEEKGEKKEEARTEYRISKDTFSPPSTASSNLRGSLS